MKRSISSVICHLSNEQNRFTLKMPKDYYYSSAITYINAGMRVGVLTPPKNLFPAYTAFLIS